MSLTQKHFVAIAAIIKKQPRSRSDAPVIGVIALELADYFETQNVKFDRARFLTACGF